MITFVMKHFYPDVSGLLQDENVPMRFDDYGNDLNNMLWALQSPDVKDQIRSELYSMDHHQNTKLKNMVWKNGDPSLWYNPSL